MPINYDEIDSNEESIKNSFDPNHPEGQLNLQNSQNRVDKHIKLIEQDPFHPFHAHPTHLANTLKSHYELLARQNNFKSTGGTLTPEHLLNIHKLALNNAHSMINRVRTQTIKTENTMTKSQRIRAIFENALSEIQNPTLKGKEREGRVGRYMLSHLADKARTRLASGRSAGDVAAETKDSLESHAKGAEEAVKMRKAGIHGNAPKPTVMGSAKKLAGLAGQQGPVKGEKAWQGPKGEGDPIPWGPKARTESTNNRKAGIRSLFEAVINEILRNPRAPGETPRTPVPYPELVRVSRQLRQDLKTSKEGGLRALAGLAGEKPDPKELADLPPKERPPTSQLRKEVADQDREDSSINHYRADLKALFEAVINEVSKRDKQRQANKAYREGEGKPFQGAGRKLANLTKKFKAKQPKQPEKSPFRTPDPKDPSDWGIDPIPSDRVNTKPRRKPKPEPDPSEEKMRSPHIN